MPFKEGEVVLVAQPEKKKKTPRFSILEIEKPAIITEFDEETSNAVAGLADNPGFIALMEKLKYRRAMLESTIKRKQDTLRDYDRLQLGIEWSLFWENEVKSEVYRRSRAQKPRKAFEIEEREFLRMQEALKVVGA